jgi:hypothetical protein
MKVRASVKREVPVKLCEEKGDVCNKQKNP